VELRIVDEAGTILAEPGKTGRLEVRMPSVCAGYRAADDKPSDPPHQPEERFRPDGWFATGDEYLQDPDGFYHHRGRTGDMLRVSGIWISPAEIEDVLAGIRSISETAAVLGESEIGLAEIVLYIVPAPGADGSAAVAAARRPARSSATSFASNCSATRIDAYGREAGCVSPFHNLSFCESKSLRRASLRLPNRRIR
jgi:benzoate-CoA ligase